MTGKFPAKRKQFDELVKPIDREKLRARAVTALAVIGGLWAAISIVLAVLPNSRDADPTPGNGSVPASTLVTGFARDYVTTYLTSKAGDEQHLARYVTVSDVKLPPVAGQFTDTDVIFAKQLAITEDGVALWTVTVSGVVNGETTAAPQRTFYRVPITVLDGAPRATALPMQIAGPGIGVDFKLGYGQIVALGSTLGQTAAGFVNSYLTGGADFTRYVTSDSTDKPILPAPYAKVDPLRIDSNVGDDGSGATTAEVYVSVIARTKNYTVTQLAYPLSLRSVEGRWQVVAIAATPLLKTTPDAPGTTAATTTTSTPPPPPPTRG